MLESCLAWEACLVARISEPEPLKLYHECVQMIERSLCFDPFLLLLLG